MVDAPIGLARVLAAEYGDVLEPANYIRGVAISGRLRLHRLAPDGNDPAAGIAETVALLVTPEALEALRGVDGSVHAGYVWANELSDAAGDDRYSRFLAASHAQPDSGLWWHCGASPYYWGRGNAFAALGFSEGLSYLPDAHPQRAALEATHRAHIEALITHRDSSGAWRQVIDRPDSYLELTATAMIGIALSRGMARGWLPASMGDATTSAWAAVAERVDEAGMVRDACMGTGPMPELDDYLNRGAVSGHDDRAGARALWFVVEHASLIGDAAP